MICGKVLPKRRGRGKQKRKTIIIRRSSYRQSEPMKGKYESQSPAKWDYFCVLCVRSGRNREKCICRHCICLDYVTSTVQLLASPFARAAHLHNATQNGCNENKVQRKSYPFNIFEWNPLARSVQLRAEYVLRTVFPANCQRKCSAENAVIADAEADGLFSFRRSTLFINENI